MKQSKRDRARAKKKRSTSKAQNGNDRKPRETMLWVDFGKDQILSGMSAPNERGEVFLFDEKGNAVVPKRIEVGTSYRRAKGPKIITRAETNPWDIRLDVNRHLGSYDWVFAADTNTMMVGNERVSVCAIVLIRDILFDGPKWSAKLIPQAALEFRDARVPPERLGWRHALWAIAQSKLTGKIAIFVDSEVNELSELNRRKKELLPEFHVPEHVTLIYGSSDVDARELIGNKAIRECDRHAGALIDRIEAGESPEMDFQSDLPKYCSRYRLWL